MPHPEMQVCTKQIIRPITVLPKDHNVKVERLFLLLGLRTLDLCCAAERLLAVLALLAYIVEEKTSVFAVQEAASSHDMRRWKPPARRGGCEDVRCCLPAFSIFVARPTRTRR